MTDIWRAFVLAELSTTVSKSLIDVSNAVGSGRIVRVRRIWHLSGGENNVSETMVPFVIARAYPLLGNNTIAPTPLSSRNAALPLQITCGTGRAYQDIATFRAHTRSNAEMRSSGATGTTLTVDIQTDPQFNMIWDAGYRSTTAQQITLREGEAFHLRQSAAAGAVQTMTLAIEFTNEAS